MDDGKKNATKILTTNDIRKEARNWTLAADVGLLTHLEQFSENIISRSQETQKLFTELVDDYEELFTKTGNVTNQFLALQNCQFVENRVYDEETPTEEKTEVKVQNEVEQEKLLLMQYKEAVEVGIKLLDTHFEEVQLPPNSDSEDDDEISAGNSVIWKPKNPYAEKKFPLLIGSAEWWEDDHVGLGSEEDVVETEKIVSDSESEMESPKSIEKGARSSPASSVENERSVPKKPDMLDSSSENLFGPEKSENIKSCASDNLFFTRGDSLPEHGSDFLPAFEAETEAAKESDPSGGGRPPAPGPDDAEENPPAAVLSKKVDDAFTRELMAKLGSVTSGKESRARENEAREREKEEETTTKKDESLFDETDDSSDLFSTKREADRSEEIVSRKGERNLFFETESDDDLFKGKHDLFSGNNFLESDDIKTPTSRSATAAVSEGSKEFLEPSQPATESKNSLLKDLFDDLDDDDTLFAAKPLGEVAANGSSNRSFSSVETNNVLKKTKSDITAGIVWNSEDALFDDCQPAPTDDDDLFRSSALLNPRAVRSTETRTMKSDAGLFPQESQKDLARENSENFGSKSSLLESSVAAIVPTVKKTSEDRFGLSPAKKIGILDSEDDDDDLFSKGPRERKSALRPTTFVDDDDAAALFGEPPKAPDAVSVSSSRSSLFDDASVSKTRLASVFEKDRSGLGGGGKPDEDLFSASEDSLFGGKERVKGERERERSSLFGEYDDDEDLFVGKSSSEVGVGEAKQTAGGVKSIADNSEEDLFTSSGTPNKLRETKSDILRQSEHKLFVDDEDDADLFSAKPIPPNSLLLKGTEGEAKGKTIGKLNIPDNLKIRFESAAKRISPGGVTSSVAEDVEQENEKNEDTKGKKDDVLDEPPPSSNLLKCPSKDRVKIPGRRRPQSRRARQEALRASGTWDQPSSPAPALLPSPPAPDPLSNPLSPSTDEEDFFKVPELDTNFEKEDQSIFKNDLFESSKSSKTEESLLFDGAPVLSPLGSRKKSDKPKPASIFDDDDDLNVLAEDDDSLFKSPKPLGGQLPPKGGEPKKASLFEESDDEDDLFGGKSAVAAVATEVTKPLQKRKEEREEKETEKEEEKEVSAFVDPLGLITKN